MAEVSGRRRYKIAVIGGGTAGWMAAAGLRRRLSADDYAIALVESDEIGTVGVGEATLPHIRAFNDMLGLDEAAFMRATGATFKLGIEFVGWGDPADRYIHPFGAFGEPWAGVPFHHHWLRARRAGRDDTPLQAYSYAIAAARAGIFDFPDEDVRSIRSTYAYAYHFDAGRYAALLRNWAEDRGVVRHEGTIDAVDRNAETGDIDAVTLRSGQRVEADLFVDCTGFGSLLLGKTLDTAWQDWTHWLPCDRALALPCEGVEALTPYTRATAQQAGWTWRIPLQHRTGNGYVFSSAFIDGDAARETLLRAIDGAPLGEPRLLRFAPGRREVAWAANCVAIGLSSGFLEPLESTSIFLIQAAISDLVDLMPRADDRRVDPRLRTAFNRLFAMHYDRVRDFLVLHYTANARTGEPFWNYVREMPLPDSLVAKLALYRARGALPAYQFGLFSADSWLSVLAGQGVEPAAFAGLADALPLDALDDKLSVLRERIAAGTQQAATHRAFVAEYCA